MRTTLTLDDGNADRLKELATKSKRSFKQVVNEVIRRGLDAMEVEEPQAPYTVKAKPMGLRKGFDPARLSKLESELDIEAFNASTLQKNFSEK